jgi:hypothetical protein
LVARTAGFVVIAIRGAVAVVISVAAGAVFAPAGAFTIVLLGILVVGIAFVVTVAMAPVAGLVSGRVLGVEIEGDGFGALGGLGGRAGVIFIGIRAGVVGEWNWEWGLEVGVGGRGLAWGV